MRKLTYYIACSVDGFICHSNGSVDGFLMEGPHADAFVARFAEFDTVLMGAKTYEFGFQYGLQPGQPAYPNLKHYVFSKSMDFVDSEWVEKVPSNPEIKVRDLKAVEGKGIWLCGGGQLAGLLIRHQLVDEIILKVNPILLGEGRPMAQLCNQTSLKFLHQEVYSNGVVELTYAVNK